MSLLGDELQTMDVGDERIKKRSIQLLERLGSNPQVSIPAACNGWHETKAAYRLFDNKKVTAQDILEPHYACSAQRMSAHPVVLCVQDTTEADYTGKNDIQGLGPLNYETRRGLYLHPTLAITPERLCLGVIDCWSWSRTPGSLGNKDTNRAIEDKESYRWLEGYRRICEQQADLATTQLVYVADREGDIYDIFHEHDKQADKGEAADWLIRGQYDRLLENDGHLLAQVEDSPVLGDIEFDIPPGRGRAPRHVIQTLQCCRVTLKGVSRPGGRLNNVTITVILAREKNPPDSESAVEWVLLTNQSLSTFEEAAQRVQWYLCRWQIEIYFKILKSGCQIEKLQLEKLERLEPALAFYMIIAWRVLFLTVMGRTCPEMPCDVVFETEEWQAVYVVAKRQAPPDETPRLNEMIRMIATFGGFLNRKGDGEPGAQTVWIGLQRTRDFALAMEVQRSLL